MLDRLSKNETNGKRIINQTTIKKNFPDKIIKSDSEATIEKRTRVSN
jgi:hypothetical protein